MADCYIGIDTSNYTTSVALASEEGEILANLKAPLPVKSGERGLRQSDAVFAHVKNLPALVQELRSHLKGNRVLAVGVSTRPRDAEDSYMPCFLSGRVAAESLASGLDVPVEEFSHQNGHVMAALYGAEATDLIGEDFLVAPAAAVDQYNRRERAVDCPVILWEIITQKEFLCKRSLVRNRQIAGMGANGAC